MSEPKITVCLLNWKRPENLYRVIDALRSQTEPIEIFLWDNAENEPSRNYRVDWYVKSNRNLKCIPRWWMAQAARTPYLMTWDDDLMPSDNELLADLLKQFDEQRSRFGECIVGAFGKCLFPNLDYEHCPTAIAGACDIILGRMMLLEYGSLRRLPPYDENWATSDDIVISSMVGGADKIPNRHFVSFLGMDRITELPDDFALCHEEGHFQRREAARREWFNR